MAIKMTGSALFLGLIVCLALVKSCNAQEPWTPEDFDWGIFQVAPKDQWNGLYLNLTSNPLPASAAVMEVGKPGQINEHAVLFIPFSIGLAFQALEAVVTAASFALAVKGCVNNDGGAEAVLNCVIGLAGTAFSVGNAYKAAKGAGWFARGANTWSDSGLENIALDVFNKRSQDEIQDDHEQIMQEVLRRSFGGAPEFMGYAHDGHRLSRRDEDHLHPSAPIFRFTHPRHGLMDVASREHVNGTRFTFSYANHGLEKRQSFQHERLSDHVFEGRFDGEASRADPGDISFDAAGAYDQVEDSVKCFVGNEWPAGNVLSAQFYDTQNEGTFGFASLGVFENNDQDSELQDFKPSGMPLAEPSC
ncbi:hypothetical protein SLS56_007882 [Neofusicoccum ribis]|uniref:Uncharacterized protein n=1 Tax=Neofusicoccum ribis TaxID=45134 RepID=A0ABR3SLS7_9PEZI